MAKQTVFLGKIVKPAQAKAAAELGPDIITIQFEGGQSGLLDLSYRPAVVWQQMLDYLQQNNRPVYVEIDPDTRFITAVQVPQAARVWQIIPAGENVVEVIFHTSSARHYLRRNHPHFQQMLDALQAALDNDKLILVTSVQQDFEIIRVEPMPGSFGNGDMPLPAAPVPAPAPGDMPEPPPPPGMPVSLARATDLFNLMKAQSCTPCAATGANCIPFKFPPDGCWIRAHLMCYLMIAEGETPEKIWIEGGLLVATANVHSCQVGWGWHVAPTLMVTPDGGGAPIKMVIDPSLFDAPVTVDQWSGVQGDPSPNLYATSWLTYWHGGNDSDNVSQPAANNYMNEYRIELDTICNTYGPSPYACPIVKRCFFIVDRNTIAKDEVDAMLALGNPANIDAAFYVIVDGFTPQELGITAATLSGVPNIVPTVSLAPGVAQMSVAPMATLGLEYPTHLNRRQRITWKYKISFTGSSGFVNELETITLSAGIATVSGTANLYLIKQPNPYEIDGPTSWLSTDVRVFQINANQTRFNETMGTNANTFITNVIAKLNNNTAGADTFEGISTDQQTARLELSESVGGTRVYNFAIAKVRYRALSVSATDVRVFFRLFPAASTSLEYQQATTYRRAVQGGTTKPLLGIIGGEVVTIPCFATPRVDTLTQSMTIQTDSPNVQTLPPNPSGNEVVRYFGCWLDFNQTAPHFPLTPGAALDGPYAAADRQSVMDHIRNEHQCLVAEIAFDPVTIQPGASPAVSDKLAQRNLAIVESDNPGGPASHRIPHTFEIKPSHSKALLADELMIDWGNIPAGTTATLYLPGTRTNDIMDMVAQMYQWTGLVRIDAHTLQCVTGGVTYMPVPPGEGANYAALMTVDLPDNVKKGQHFTIVVHQVTNITSRPIITHEIGAAAGAEISKGRRILGSFQISIPVTVKERMLVHEQRLLANLRWIQRAIPAHNRWYPVFNRYVQQIGQRVDALGGDASQISPSPSDNWQQSSKWCGRLGWLIIILLALLVVACIVLKGNVLLWAVILLAIALVASGYYWLTHCRKK